MNIEKRTVRFADLMTVSVINSCKNMSTAEKDDRWYSREELDTFREDVKAYVKLLSKSGEYIVKKPSISFRDCVRTSVNAIVVTPDSCSGSITRNDATPEAIELRERTRGLEHRFDVERQRNKCISRIAVVEAQRRIRVRARTDLDPAIHLAMIASKFSSWANEIALQTARMDASDAYPPPGFKQPPTETVTESRNYRREEAFVAHRKKARISYDSFAACIRPCDALIGEQILRRKNVMNVNQSPVFVSGCI